MKITTIDEALTTLEPLLTEPDNRLMGCYAKWHTAIRDSIVILVEAIKQNKAQEDDLK